MALSTGWNVTTNLEVGDRSAISWNDLSNFNFANKFGKIKEGDQTTTIRGNSVPVNCPDVIRVQVYNENDVYKNTQINPAKKADVTTGKKIFIQETSVDAAQYSPDGTEVTKEVLLPYSVSLSVTVPDHEAITPEMILGRVKHCMCALYKNGSLNIAALRNGATNLL